MTINISRQCNNGHINSSLFAPWCCYSNTLHSYCNHDNSHLWCSQHRYPICSIYQCRRVCPLDTISSSNITSSSSSSSHISVPYNIERCELLDLFTCTQAYKETHTNIYIQKHIYRQTDSHIYTHRLTHLHTYIHEYTRIYI